ncbi:hypothetical protein FIBSPDRAFT_325241 [Athelia psychrophila]|uniref:Uncharacterized protein n=1 Tax=Athelia psychrophila TaxID=1759441 RepID=A0A167WM28_9AGAM|nr:hypothetical protein FIBSPDRAFT_325241 [Fibularhizoctonia sp. CBS 109695]
MQPPRTGARAYARALPPAHVLPLRLLHISTLRVLCASRANAPRNPRASGTTAKMASMCGPCSRRVCVRSCTASRPSPSRTPSALGGLYLPCVQAGAGGMLGARFSATRNFNRPYVSKHAHAHS